jgi:hypothetical protein
MVLCTAIRESWKRFWKNTNEYTYIHIISILGGMKDERKSREGAGQNSSIAYG